MRNPRPTADRRPALPARAFFRPRYANGRAVLFHRRYLPELLNWLETKHRYAPMGALPPIPCGELTWLQHRTDPDRRIFIELGNWWPGDRRWAPECCRAILSGSPRALRWAHLLPAEAITARRTEVAR